MTLPRERAPLVELLRPEWATWWFSVALLLAYAVAPAAVYLFVVSDPVFLRLAGITTVGVMSMWLGASLPIADGRFATRRTWLVIDPYFIIGVSLAVFVLFIAVTFATAPSIPFLSALKGADPNTLSQERGDFLKGRQGWQVALLYIGTFLVNTIVPYSIVLAYAIRARARHLLALFFFAFCISFLQKALFLNMVLPLLAYFAMSGKLKARQLWLAGGISVVLLVAFTYLSGMGEAGQGSDGGAALAEVLSAQYLPATPFGYFLWRAFAVPLFSATDTLIVHAQYFDGRPLLGVTSSFVSSLLGIERINLERFVFEYQFGAWNDVANSNTMYLLDGYVNFGWVGVVVFGALVGQVLRWFRLTPDRGMRSLWMLFCFVLFSSPLLGMLLSNGWLYMLVHALVVRADVRPATRGG